MLRNVNHSPTFIDLFAGIGGMRLGLEAVGAQCVYSCERDPFARRTYECNFPSHDVPFEGDITQIDVRAIPDHDILTAGFPCQPFSLAGVSKKKSLGRGHGFEDLTQGTLFFNVAEILATKQPAAFILENVKNLRSHDGGRTFDVILEVLDRVGYAVAWNVMDARPFVPQHRERIFIVGVRRDLGAPSPELRASAVEPAHWPVLADVLHPEDGTEAAEEPYTVGPRGQVNDKYTLSPRLWSYLQSYAAKHRAAGNGFGFGLVGRGSTHSRTLSARYHKDGSEILVDQGSSSNPRRLTPREASRLMGFNLAALPRDRISVVGETWQIPVSDTQAYRQFGNAVVPQAVASVAEPLIAILARPGAHSPTPRPARQLALSEA